MPFEGINFGLARPTVPIEGPMDTAMKSMAYQQARQQVQMGGMQTHQLEKQMNDAQELQDTLRGAESPEDAYAQASRLGTKASQEWAKSYQEMKTKKVELDTKQYDLSTKKMGQIGSVLLGEAGRPGATPDSLRGLITSGAQQGVLPQEQAQRLMETVPTDPKDLPAWARLQAVQLGTAEHTLKMFTPETKVQGTSAITMAPSITGGGVTGVKQIAGMPASEVAKELQDYNASSGKPPVGINDHAFVAWHDRIHPSMALSMMGQGTPSDLSKPLMDPGMEAIAQAIARGDQAPQEYSTRNPAGKPINARAAAIASDAGNTLQGKIQVAANAAGKKDFEPNGTSGKTISALNTMTEHLATADRLAQAMNSGDIPLINKLGQQLGIQMGNNTATNFNTLKQFLAGEVAKVATGGHITEGEIHAASDRLNSAGSPSQLSGALATMREVAGGKLVAVNQDYQRLFGKSLADSSRLTTATKSAFQSVYQQHGNTQPTTSYSGKTASTSDLKSTADANGMTLDQVTKKWLAGGGKVVD